MFVRGANVCFCVIVFSVQEMGCISDLYPSKRNGYKWIVHLTGVIIMPRPNRNKVIATSGE